MANIDFVDRMTPEEKSRVRANVWKALSEIFSDKHDCKITLTGVPRDEAQRAALPAQEAV